MFHLPIEVSSGQISVTKVYRKNNIDYGSDQFLVMVVVYKNN